MVIFHLSGKRLLRIKLPIQGWGMLGMFFFRPFSKVVGVSPAYDTLETKLLEMWRPGQWRMKTPISGRPFLDRPWFVIIMDYND